MSSNSTAQRQNSSSISNSSGAGAVLIPSRNSDGSPQLCASRGSKSTEGKPTVADAIAATISTNELPGYSDDVSLYAMIGDSLYRLETSTDLHQPIFVNTSFGGSVITTTDCEQCGTERELHLGVDSNQGVGK